MLTVANTAPDFTLPRDGGGEVTLSAFRPGKVVLYFYPKDDTPGCTLEAQDFSARAAEFSAANTTGKPNNNRRGVIFFRSSHRKKNGEIIFSPFLQLKILLQ